MLYQHYLKYVWHKPELNPYLLSVYLTAQFLIHILCPHNLKTININIFNQLSLYPSTDRKGPCAHRNKGLIWVKMTRKPWVLRPHLGVPEKKKALEPIPGTSEIQYKWVLTFTCLGSQEFATKAPRSRRAHRDGHHSEHHGPGRRGTWHIAKVLWAIQSA